MYVLNRKKKKKKKKKKIILCFIVILNLDGKKISFVFEFRQWFHRNGPLLKIENLVVFEIIFGL